MAERILMILAAMVVMAIIAAVIAAWRNPVTLFYWKDRRALANAGFAKTLIASAVGEQCVWEKGFGPTLIFLHGLGDHAGSWARVAPSFTPNYRVVIPDLAGHEESEPKTGTLHMGAVLAGVDAVVRARAGDSPIIFVGNSLGAWSAIVYAHQHPERVARIIATGGGPLRGEWEEVLSKPRTREDMQKLLDLVVDPGSPHAARFVVDDLLRHAQRGPMARFAESGIAELEGTLLEGRLGEVKTPVDLIWGESDRLVPLKFARRMQKQLSAVRLTTIPHCGHIPQQECPKAYSSALRQVLLQAPPLPSDAPSRVKEEQA
ncbi:MAG TPA: alpha/beta hydrolase [candidate division Zixibacteria bacterium]|nr:alpha/beta hydrolase [candidate division Zixibacteria bacterium]